MWCVCPRRSNRLLGFQTSNWFVSSGHSQCQTVMIEPWANLVSRHLSRSLLACDVLPSIAFPFPIKTLVASVCLPRVETISQTCTSQTGHILYMHKQRNKYQLPKNGYACLHFLVLFLFAKGYAFFIITRRRDSVHHLPDPSGSRDLPMCRPGGSDPVIYNNRERTECGGRLIQALLEYSGWVSGEGWRGGTIFSNPAAYY